MTAREDEAHYLAATDARGQSGFRGGPARWERARRPILAAAPRPGTFLDVGCANGLLMESVQRWARQEGHEIEPYGLEISPELADLARRRLPRWADRIFVGNALGWQPPSRFAFVRTGLDYVPPPRRRDLVEHLLAHVVAPAGRLIVGVFNEEVERRALEEEVVSWGFAIAGRSERPKDDPRLAYRVFWIDGD